MTTIYIDSDYKCYATNGEGRTPVETENFFDGKCEAFIEGYRLIKTETSETIVPWKPFEELDAAQREYERAELERLRAENADMLAALNVLGVTDNG